MDRYNTMFSDINYSDRDWEKYHFSLPSAVLNIK